MCELKIKRISSVDEIKGSPKNIVGNINWAEYPYKPEVTFSMGYNDKFLFIHFEVVEDHIKAQWLNDNESVWEDSCVEIFIKKPDGTHYFNFEVNCIGTILAARRTGRSDAKHLDGATLARIIRVASLPHEKIDTPAEGSAWEMTLGIPFDIIECNDTPSALKANIYKCGDKTAVPHFVSWAPIDTPTPDFHRPEFFGTLFFI